MPSPPAGPVPARMILRQTRLLLRDDLRDETAEREPKQIDFIKTESAYECDRILRHLLDRFGSRTSGSADTTIVEHNNVVLRCQAIYDPGVPIIQHCRQMVEEDHGDAALPANLPEHEGGAVNIDRFGRRILEGHAHHFFPSILREVRRQSALLLAQGGRSDRRFGVARAYRSKKSAD